MAPADGVTTVGNLGTDPETRYMLSGDTVTSIRVVTTDRYKDKASSGMEETTEWHHIAFFSRSAEIAGEYLKKGSQAYIEGHLKTCQWEKGGQKQHSIGIVADQLQILGRTSGDRGAAGADDFESEDEIPLWFVHGARR